MRLLATCLAMLLAQTPGPAGLPRLEAAGIPFIQNHGQKEYGAGAQNWALAQDHRGLLYAANNLGVLEYDGVRWRLIPTAKGNVVRSLGVAADGKVYVGSVGELGVLEPDADGQTRYTSLTGLLPEADRQFTDVWVTAATPRGILFQTRERLLLLSGGRFRSWRAATSFHVAFVAQGRILVRQREVGLLELKGDRLELIPGGDRFAKESVFTVLPLEPGALLVGSRNLGFWRLADGALTGFPTEADGFLKLNSLYHGAQLSDGTLALATISGGVALMDRAGRLKGILDRAAGLLGDNVKSLFPDRQGALWMALDNGISRVEWPSSVTLFDERLGLRGTVWALHRHQGTLYAATGQGVFALAAGPGSTGGYRRQRFQPLPGLAIQSSAFLSMDQTLLLACGRGVFDLQGPRLRPVRPSSTNAISLCRSRVDPNRVFVGLQGGLAALRRVAGGWVDEGLVPGVGFDIYSVAEAADGRLWLSTGAQGLLRVTLPAGWPRAGASPRVERFTTAQGLPSDADLVAQFLEGEVAFTTHQGLFRFREATGRFQADPRFQALFPAGPRWIKALRRDPEGRIWLDSTDEVRGIHETGRAIPQADGSYRWDPEPFRRFAEVPIEAILPEPGGGAWFGGPAGALRYEPSAQPAAAGAPPPLIRTVTAGGSLVPVQAPVLAYARRALRFEFAVPSFDQPAAHVYQVLLEGYERAWSPWTAEPQKEYTNLPEGSYRFRVRARDGHGAIPGEAAFGFRILPPWFRSWWAFAGYLGAGSLLILLGVRLRVRLLHGRNLALQGRVDQATEELRERERMLAAQAGQLMAMNGDLQSLNERLKEVNEQKDRFLGIVVHDLRNPLHVILLAAQRIEEGLEPADAQAKASAISTRGTEMSLLINRFLDIAALDSGQIQAEPETFPLLELLLEMAERHGPRARQKGIELRLEPSGPELVHVDPKFMRSVLDNLVSNAVKFTPGGRAVTLSLARSGDWVTVTVADQGPGLTPADQQKLFGRFAKLSAQPTGGEKSVGLGLSITKQMVEAIGGQIWVESEPGQGASFRVQVPAAPGLRVES